MNTNLPDVRPQVPSVDNVLQEMMLAGQTDGLLAEVLLQLKTFYKIVWAAAYGNDISVSVTFHEISMNHGPTMWRQQVRHPDLDISMTIREFDDGHAIHDLLTKAMYNEDYPAIIELETGVDMRYADGTGTVNIGLKIPGGYPYGDRWHKLFMVMFNATKEMKDKVDYIASMKVGELTELEDALYQTCRALSAFYEWSMRTNSRFWNRDPYSRAPREQEQIAYEPRLGRF